MCGIVACWGKSDPSVIETTLKILGHRGPDDRHAISVGRATIGHLRLAIIDINGGPQPILNESRQTAIAVNGAIYNYQQIKSQLRDQHVFRTANDSEVPLHLYEEIGEAMLQQLEGMFALVLTDGETFLVARDMVGIKPLYYGRSNQQLFFASEIKALLDVATDIKAVPPGYLFHSQNATLTPYGSFPTVEPLQRSEADWLHSVQTVVEQAIVKQLVSDAPLGVLLSGGLDSSIIAAVARNHTKKLHTFTVGLAGSQDLVAARCVADYIGSVHHELIFTIDDIKCYLPTIIYHLESFDKDLVESAIPSYFAAQLASKWVKVILTGEGADELFAGYRYYRNYRDLSLLPQELSRSLANLHHLNLQRVDRMTMAHSIEGRVPFLDREVIAVAQSLPPPLKLYRDQENRITEKWILRKAFEDRLPKEIVWRTKKPIDEGCGMADIIQDLRDYFMLPEQAQLHRRLHGQCQIGCHLESVYHKLLCEPYQKPQPLLKSVARWRHNRYATQLQRQVDS